MLADTALVRYDAMCRAIANCPAIDEVKDIRDKAVALALYHRQANNLDAEIECGKVRLRAEHRCGEILKEMQRAPTASGGDEIGSPPWGADQHVALRPGPGRQQYLDPGRKPDAGPGQRFAR